MQQQHNKKPEQYLYRERGTEATFRVHVTRGVVNNCPVPGCPGGSRDKFGMYRHFCARHPEAVVIIPEDGRLERCPLCQMFSANITAHQATKTCQKLRQRQTNEELQDRQAEAGETEFTIYGKKLERVSDFRYLGRVLAEDDDDTICIEGQLKKARKTWGSIAKILKREGANAKTMGKFYVTVVQAVLLYGADSWVVSKGNMRKLQSFHRRAVRYMTNQHITKRGEGDWVYPDHGELERQCGLHPIATYIEQRRGTLRKYLEDFRPDLLAAALATRAPARHPNKLLWWNQPYITKEDFTHFTP